MERIAPGLGESQRTLLELLKRKGLSTLARLESGLDLARETLRDHLKVLAGEGLVERAGVRRAGRGRPQVLYRLSEAGEALFPRREGELLGELAGFLLDQGEGELLERFFEARTAEKRDRLLHRVEGLQGPERFAEVARILTEEGFLAEIGGSEDTAPRLQLCHCPLRHLVEVTKLPCRAELRLVRELLGADLQRTDFMPDGDTTCSYRIDVSAAAMTAES